MSSEQANAVVQLADFDDLFVGHPAEIEQNLSALLPAARSLDDKSLYLQILSQIALAQAMQQKFVLAHQTLDSAEADLTPAYDLAGIRITLERGRVFHQADNAAAALPLFKQSFEQSSEKGFAFHAINAAHMVAIAANHVEDKIHWNRVAIEAAETTQDERARAWLGVLYNNLAQSHVAANQYSEALSAFEQCQQHAESRGDAIVVRGAKWGIGRALRSLGRLEEALQIQCAILAEYQAVAANNELPPELLVVGRGMVYEELAEIHLAHVRRFASLAYDDLVQDSWFARLEPTRLEKLNRLRERPDSGGP